MDHDLHARRGASSDGIEAAISARCPSSAREPNVCRRVRSRPAKPTPATTAATASTVSAAIGCSLSVIAMKMNVSRPAATAAVGCRSAQLARGDRVSSPHCGQACVVMAVVHSVGQAHCGTGHRQRCAVRILCESWLDNHKQALNCRNCARYWD
jgi:hypothetical protein